MNQIIENLSDKEVMALTIFGEARGEPIEGQIAVACVIRNRFHDLPGKFKSLKDVCFQKNQFSCWNESDVNYPMLLEMATKFVTGATPTDPSIRQCFLIVTGVLDWSIMDNTKGAINYLTSILFNSPSRPTWAKTPKNVVTKGTQVFFTA